jgi:hypothetical protein
MEYREAADPSAFVSQVAGRKTRRETKPIIAHEVRIFDKPEPSDEIQFIWYLILKSKQDKCEKLGPEKMNWIELRDLVCLWQHEPFYVVRYSCDVTDDILIPLPYNE